MVTVASHGQVFGSALSWPKGTSLQIRVSAGVGLSEPSPLDVRLAASATVCCHRIGGGTDRCKGQDETTTVAAFSMASAISSWLARAKPGVGSSVVMALRMSSCTSSPNVKGSS